MDERPIPPDPNAFTQPIPVVQVAPPPRPVGPVTIVEPPYAHRFGSLPWYFFGRFAAFVIDYLGVAFVAATFGFHFAERGFLLFAGRDEAGFATLVAASLGFAIVFAFVCEASFGTTLGKLVFALHVRRRDGRHAGGGRAFVRAVVRPIDLVVVGPLVALVTPRRQRLGDLLAGTVVAGSRLRAFASLIGIALIAGVAYAQITFGGGLTSAIGVIAETTNYAPDFYARAANAIGIAVPRPATVAPAVQSSVAPAVQPSALPSVGPPPASAAPQVQPTDDPTPAPASSGTSNV